MSVASTDRKVEYSCNGSTTDFAVPFGFFEQSDLVVYLIHTNTLARTDLALTTDYTISTVNNDYRSGATVTTVATYSSDYDIYIERVVPLTQNSVYDKYGAFPAKTTEDALDRLTMITQQLKDDAENSHAIHDNVASEIDGIEEKTLPVADDLLIIEDSEDSNNKKKMKYSNVQGIDAVLANTIHRTGDGSDHSDVATNTTHRGRTDNPHVTTKFHINLGNVQNTLCKFDATTAPTVNDDTGDGYTVGSRWIDITNDKVYDCVDATAGAAVWNEVGAGSGSGATDDTAWTGDNWTAATASPSQNRIQEALKEVAVDYDEMKALDYANDENLALTIKKGVDGAYAVDYQETTFNYDYNPNSTTMRITIPASEFNLNGNYLKFTLQAGNGGSLDIYKAWIGKKGSASAHAFDGSQRQVYFNNGDAGVGIPASTTIETDPIFMPNYSPDDDLVISIYLNGYVTASHDTGGNGVVWSIIAGDVAAADNPTMNEYNNQSACVLDISVAKKTMRIGVADTKTTDVAAHATSHEAGGTDAVKLDDLAEPDDNTDLNATTVKHGLLPKLDGSGSKVLGGDGAWHTPTSVPRTGIKQILGGYGAGLLLTEEGKVYTFFDNGATYANMIYAQSSAVKQSPLYGMIENITQIYVSDNPIVQIAIIGNSAFALDDTGDLYAWGENTVGTLGLGHVTDTFLPTLSATGVDSILAPDRGLCDLTATTSCAFIKKTDGKIYGTGLNTSGQLGIGSTANVNVWTEITALTGKNVTAFYQTQNCAAPIVAIVDGTDVWVAGENSNGQLGDGTTTDITTMTDMTSAWNPNGYPVKKAVAGGVTAKISLSMVLEKSATEYELRVCGDNASGQLGDGTTTDRLTPFTTKTFTSYKDIVMETYAGPLAYLTADGDLWKVGENSYGTGGNGTTTDITIWAHVASNVEAILTAWNGHQVTPEKQESFIRKADGVYGCGVNSYGASSCGLANGVPAVKNVTTYCKALFPPDVTIIKIGSFATASYTRKVYFALSSDNRIFVWSDNTNMGASSVTASYDVNVPIEAYFTRR